MGSFLRGGKNLVREEQLHSKTVISKTIKWQNRLFFVKTIVTNRLFSQLPDSKPEWDILHYQKVFRVRASRHVALPHSPACNGMRTFCTGKKLRIYGHGDTVHCQKAPYVWAFCGVKRFSAYGNGDISHCPKAFCVHQHGDTLHCPEGFYIFTLTEVTLTKRHFMHGHADILPTSFLYMDIQTLLKCLFIHGRRETVHCLKVTTYWAWRHFALPKSFLKMGIEAFCNAQIRTSMYDNVPLDAPPMSLNVTHFFFIY